jgi:hypothetical protein
MIPTSPAIASGSLVSIASGFTNPSCIYFHPNTGSLLVAEQGSTVVTRVQTSSGMTAVVPNGYCSISITNALLGSNCATHYLAYGSSCTITW